MSLRFRRSKKLGKYIKLNFSKSGVGVSVGVPGVRVGVDPKGKIRRTLGVPGTGVYDIKEIGNLKPKKPGRFCHKCCCKVGEKDKFCKHCGIKLK